MKTFLNNLVPRYGNYGGPGWTAGNGINPVDDMDSLFEQHDAGYANRDYKMADKSLLNGLNNLSLNHSNWISPPKSGNIVKSYAYRYGATAAFIAKYQMLYGSKNRGYGYGKVGY